MKIKAELFDKMQYIMESYNDHMVRAYLEFDKNVNQSILKKACNQVINQIPVICSEFNNGFIKPYWKIMDDFCIEKIFYYKECEESQIVQIGETFLTDIIQEKKEAQVKFLLLRSKVRDRFYILINHMVMDGTDFKEFISCIANVYSYMIDNSYSKLDIKNGSRSMKQIFQNITLAEQKQIFKLESQNDKNSTELTYPFHAVNCGERKSRLIQCEIKPQLFLDMKKQGKKLKASINDIVLAAFYRATISMIENPENKMLEIQNIIDLRRYVKNGKTDGFTNMVGMVTCNIGNDYGENMKETVFKIKKEMDLLKQNYPGLHDLPKLNKIMKLPFFIAKYIIRKYYNNPIFAVSNIGLIDENTIKFHGSELQNIWMTGSIKYPPHMQLSLSTFRNRITHTIAIYSTEEESRIFERMFGLYKQEIHDFVKGD